MSNVLTAVSNSENPHRFVILQDGALIASVVATLVPEAPRTFTAIVPASVAAGAYQFVVYRTSGSITTQSVARSAGDFIWDGSDIVTPLTLLARLDGLDNVTGALAGDLDVVVGNVANLLVAVADVDETTTFNRQVLEADEAYELLGDGTGTAVKTDKDTGDVLVSKTVASVEGCPQSTTITEAI